jgi:hypothetical protein
MQGLLDAAANAGFTAFMQAKAGQAPLHDPVEQVRAGWRLHVEFGLNRPQVYLQMLGTSRPGERTLAVMQATEMVRAQMQQVGGRDRTPGARGRRGGPDDPRGGDGHNPEPAGQ